MVLTALLFIVLFAVAGAQSLLVQGQVRLDTVDKQLTEQQARYQELRKDVAEKESPERIVAAAHEQGWSRPPTSCTCSRGTQTSSTPRRDATTPLQRP